MQSVRQGDLIFRKVDKVQGSKVDSSNGFVLALGEHTGHKHLAVKEQVDQFEVYKTSEGVIYMQVYAPVRINHEEHKEVILDPGIWEMGNEREFDYFLNTIKRVQD